MLLEHLQGLFSLLLVSVPHTKTKANTTLKPGIDTKPKKRCGRRLARTGRGRSRRGCRHRPASQCPPSSPDPATSAQWSPHQPRAIGSSSRKLCPPPPPDLAISSAMPAAATDKSNSRKQRKRGQGWSAWRRRERPTLSAEMSAE